MKTLILLIATGIVTLNLLSRVKNLRFDNAQGKKGLAVLILLAALVIGSEIFLALLIALVIFSLKKRMAGKQRLVQVQRALPHFLDVLSLYMRSGYSLQGALVATSTNSSLGVLQHELSQMMKRHEAGEPLIRCLQRLYERNPIDSLRQITSAVSMSLESGGSVTPTLVKLADHFTLHRMLMAERLASRLPVLLLLPLIVCIFPATFLILFYPLLVHAKSALG